MSDYNLKVSLPKIKVPFSFCGRSELLFPNILIQTGDDNDYSIINIEEMVLLKKNKNKIDSLFSKVGKTMWLKNEIEINKITAISGSGPGYIFLFIDAFEQAALQLGLGKNVTKKLVHQTFYGSINLLLTENETAKSLANKIAIKGGTTEAGLNQFKNNKILHNTFKKVVKAAYFRAIKLGK